MSSMSAKKGIGPGVRSAPSEDSDRRKKPRVEGNEDKDQAQTPSLPPTVVKLREQLQKFVKLERRNHQKRHERIAGWFEAVNLADLSSQEKNEMSRILLAEHGELYRSRKKYADQLINEMSTLSGQEDRTANYAHKIRKDSLERGLKKNMLAIFDWELEHTQDEATKDEIRKLFKDIRDNARIKFRPQHYLPELEERLKTLESTEAKRLILYCDLLEGKRGDKDGGWKEQKTYQNRSFPDYRKTVPNVIRSLINKSFPKEDALESKMSYEKRFADCNLSEAEERVTQDQEKLFNSATRDRTREELLNAPGGQDAIDKVRAKWSKLLPVPPASQNEDVMALFTYGS